MDMLRFSKVLVAVGLAVCGVHYWHQHENAVALAAAADENGFVDLPVQGQSPDTVYIVAALNCPHEAAQRADRLAKDLGDKGIPVIRTNHWNFHWTGTDRSVADALAKRLNAVGNGPLPIVFVRGWAKGAPTLDEVVAEYGQSDQK